MYRKEARKIRNYILINIKYIIFLPVVINASPGHQLKVALDYSTMKIQY